MRGSRLDPTSAAEIDAWCLERGVRCLYLLADCDDPETARVATERGYVVVDVRLTIRHDLEGLDQEPIESQGRVSFREAVDDDIDPLRRLAAASHGTTRFYFDRGFPREASDRLYARWIERALTDPARVLLVAEVDGKPAGYQASVLPQDGLGVLELLAIDPGQRGRGLGAELLRFALRYHAARGAEEARTQLQARNLPSVRMHERVGFLAERIDIWHHKWFDA